MSEVETLSKPVQKPNLLVPFQGDRPPAPDWFVEAAETPYETHFVEVNGADIHYQTWGDPTRPGLLLVHGNGAHAHWYDFIAPFLSEYYYVVAMTFGGMGDSGWRSSYSMATFSAEQIAVCEHAGLFAAAVKPVIVAHSFGGFITYYTGAEHSERFGGLIIVDTPIRPPEDKWDSPKPRGETNRIYPDLTAALARFRLAPTQTCDNVFIADYIARHSLKQVEAEDGSTGWTWKFDPQIWSKFEGKVSAQEMLAQITCPLSLMRGQHSAIFEDRIFEYMRALRGDMTMISIPGAQHHVMLDQPLAFVAALRMQLAAWFNHSF